MAVPQVVERQLTDIEVNGGLNQSVSQFALDWTKEFKALDNVDLGTPGKLGVRPGLIGPAGGERSAQTFNDGLTNSVSTLLRLLSTSNGVLALKAPTTALSSQRPDAFRAFAYDETGGTSSGMWSYKSQMPEFSVTPTYMGGINNGYGTPSVVGAVYTSKYNAVLVNIGNSFNMLLVADRGSGNIVKSCTYTTPAGRACITAVGDIVHVYIGQAGTCKCFQEDLSGQTNLTLSVTTPITLTTGDIPLACVPNAASSVVLMANGRLARVSTSLVETATQSIAGFGGLVAWDDLSTDGTDFWITGDNGAAECIQKVDSAFAHVTTSAVGAAVLDASIASAGTGLAAYGTVSLFHSATAGVPTVQIIGNGVGVGTIYNVGGITSPYYNPSTYHYYAVVTESATNSSSVNGASVLVNLTATTNFWGGQVYGTIPYSVPLHASAVCDAYNDYAPISSSTGWIRPQKLFSADSGKTMVYASLVKNGDGSYGVEFREFRLCDSTVVGSSYEAISGGITSCYDGKFLSEYSFLCKPKVSVAATAGAGLAAGSYNYVVVFECTDGNGNRHISKCSDPVNIVLGGASNVTATIYGPWTCNHGSTMSYDAAGPAGENFDMKISLYRTVSGGTQYYRVGQAGFYGSGGTVIDSTSDASLVSNALLHRQPGTTGTSLDRYYAPASSCVVRHKDRLFCARGSTVYYSSFTVTGEAAWFNPAFAIEVPGGDGPITALGSLEDNLVIFKKNAVFLVAGDGPPENGGNGTEFSPPRRLSTRSGCVDQRTLVNTNDGLVYRSPFSIEILRRNLTVEAIGQKVQSVLDSNPYNGGAAFDPATSRCIWLVGTTQGTYQGQLDSTASGTAVVYDTASDAWCTYTLRTSQGSGKAMQDVVSHDAGCTSASITTKQRFIYIDSTRLYLESGYKDNIAGTDYFIPITLETGHVRSGSRQDRIRVSDFMIAAMRNADCNVNVYYAPDYAQTYTLIKSWTPNTWGSSTIVQLEAQAPKEAVQSMSFRLATSDPTPTSFGSGQQFDIFGLTVKAGLRGAGAKLASGNKG